MTGPKIAYTPVPRSAARLLLMQAQSPCRCGGAKTCQSCQATERLVQGVGPLVWRFATSYANKLRDPRIEAEDLFSAGMCGVCRAVRMFDASRTNGFPAYAGQAAKNEMAKHVETERRASLAVTSVSPEKLERFALRSGVQLCAARRVAVQRIVGGLSANEQHAIRARFGLDAPMMSLADAGRAVGVSPETMSERFRRALEKLRKLASQDPALAAKQSPALTDVSAAHRAPCGAGDAMEGP